MKAFRINCIWEKNLSIHHLILTIFMKRVEYGWWWWWCCTLYVSMWMERKKEERKMWRKKMKIINEYYQGQWKAYYMCLLGRIYFFFFLCDGNTEFFIFFHFHHFSRFYSRCLIKKIIFINEIIIEVIIEWDQKGQNKYWIINIESFLGEGWKLLKLLYFVYAASYFDLVKEFSRN